MREGDNLRSWRTRRCTRKTGQGVIPAPGCRVSNPDSFPGVLQIAASQPQRRGQTINHGADKCAARCSIRARLTAVSNIHGRLRRHFCTKKKPPGAMRPRIPSAALRASAHPAARARGSFGRGRALRCATGAASVARPNHFLGTHQSIEFLGFEKTQLFGCLPQS
jgi:hypothetical protein